MLAHEKYKKFCGAFKNAFMERDKEVDILTTAMIAEKPVVFIGEPGTAKSHMLRVFSEAICKDKYFEYQINPYTLPDEIIGHFSFKELKDNDRQIRQTKGKIADSNITYLDEVFEGSRGLQQALLKIMNEKVVDIGEGIQLKIPLQLLVGASNRYPEDTRLAAAWDRWIFRRSVTSADSDESFTRLMLEPETVGVLKEKINMKDIQAVRKLRDKVDISEIMPFLFELKGYVKSKGIYISMRRWRHVADILKSKAAMDGRQKAQQKDLRILSEVLWVTPDQRGDVASKIAEMVAGEVMKALKIEDAAQALYNEAAGSNDIRVIGKANRELKKMLSELAELVAADTEVIPIMKRVKLYQDAIVSKVGESV